MKRITLLLILFLLTFQVKSQDISVERKQYYLNQAENKIFSLPFSYEHINGVFMPEILAKRDDLAPNYPNRALLGRDAAIINNAFQTWITTYPNEYSSYYSYLQVYYREHNH